MHSRKQNKFLVEEARKEGKKLFERKKFRIFCFSFQLLIFFFFFELIKIIRLQNLFVKGEETTLLNFWTADRYKLKKQNIKFQLFWHTF